MAFKYRLIKDLPCHPKGTIFKHKKQYYYTNGKYRTTKTIIPEDRLTPVIVIEVKKTKNFDEWFERIEKTKENTNEREK